MQRKGKTELEVFLVDSASELKLKGSAFQKSCTIYKGNEILAQVYMYSTLLALQISSLKPQKGSDFDHLILYSVAVYQYVCIRVRGQITCSSH